MTQQFDRVVEVLVNTVSIASLDASFRVVKTRKKEPNTCELTIFNLNEESRSRLAEVGSPRLKLSAGYRGRQEASSSALRAVDSLLAGSGDPSNSGIGLIFEGDMRDAVSNYEPPDWITTFESGDGEKASQFARVNRSFAAGTSLSKVLQTVAGDMGVGIGNTITASLKGVLLEAGREFINGVTVSGSAHKEFDRIVKSSGLEWSVQDDVIQLLSVGGVLLDTAVVLSAETGLIGSPTIGNDGVVRFRALMNSDIVPARLILLKSRAITGRLRVERCEYTGSIADVPFYVDVEATEL